jgi:hypothetical protein
VQRDDVLLSCAAAAAVVFRRGCADTRPGPTTNDKVLQGSTLFGFLVYLVLRFVDAVLLDNEREF